MIQFKLTFTATNWGRADYYYSHITDEKTKTETMMTETILSNDLGFVVFKDDSQITCTSLAGASTHFSEGLRLSEQMKAFPVKT